MESAILLTVVDCDEERSAATRLIRRKYLELFGTVPSEAETYIIGRHEGAVKGTIGFELPKESGSLSIPERYNFDKSEIPPCVKPDTVCQSNRWTSEEPNPDLSIALVYAVCMYAQARKKEHIWIEQTPGAHRLLTRSGIRFHDIPSAKVMIERVDEKDRAYFRHHDPKPSIMLPTQVIGALARRMHSLVNAGTIAFDASVLS